MGLAELGLKPGDRLALWLPNVPAWLGLMLACARLGVIVVSVNTRFRSVEVADIVSRSGARVLVLWPGFKDIDFVAMLGEIGERLAAVETMVLYDEADDTDPEVLARLDAIPGERNLLRYQDLDSNAPYVGDAEPDDGCAIFTTSGTTRAPKFVLHSQRPHRGPGRGFHGGRCDDPDGAALMRRLRLWSGHGDPGGRPADCADDSLRSIGCRKSGT